jgi:hypothetical protein
MLAGAWPFTARSGKATFLVSSCFPGESGEARAGAALSATAVTAAARGKIGDFVTAGTIPAMVRTNAIVKGKISGQ